jgi:hypothetical protein
MEPTDFSRAEKPVVMAIRLSVTGELTHGLTVEEEMPLPMASTMTLMPAFCAARK